MDKQKQSQAAISIAVMESGLCEAIDFLRSDLLVAGYKIQIYDEAVHMDLVLLDEIYKSTPDLQPYQEVLAKSFERDAEEAKKAMLIGTYDIARYIEPTEYKTMVKNDHHGNEPWRRKQWRHR